MWASASADCTAALWDTRLHPAKVQVRRLDRTANCVQFSPNDAFIAVGSDNLYMIDLRARAMRSLSSLTQVSEGLAIYLYNITLVSHSHSYFQLIRQ